MIDKLKIKDTAYNSLLELSTDQGFNASGKNEIYGCFFGRDNVLTLLKILRVHSRYPSEELLEVCRRALLTLVEHQGRAFNVESGEQPGKFIHEFRKDNFNHLLALERPWYIYPDGILRNYDSIDSTPLSLIGLYKYWKITGDNGFLGEVLPAVEEGLNWLITFGDQDKDSLIEYSFDPERRYGGLVVQSWTDSHESMRDSRGNFPKYPIAPVEVQGYAWLAFRLWADYYLKHAPEFGKKLFERAKKIKKSFNRLYVFENEGKIYLANALDGDKKQIRTVTPNPLLCLWASYDDGLSAESVVEKEFIGEVVGRAFGRDLFVGDAGLRTMSSSSPTYNPHQDSYHNGSFWPILNGLVVEGLENFGYFDEAARLIDATLLPIEYFDSPIELYVKGDEGYMEYRNSGGQVSCRQQAWSAAVLLDLATP